MLIAVLPPVSALAENPCKLPSRMVWRFMATPALPKDFDHFPYANPDAPKGGSYGSASAADFASLNPFNARFGDAPQLVIGNVVQSLMMRSQDEPYSLLSADRPIRRTRRSAPTRHISHRSSGALFRHDADPRVGRSIFL